MGDDNQVNNLCDISAERAVLSGLFEYGHEAYLDIIDFLQIDTFVDPINQQIFKCLNNAFDNKKLTDIDIPTILGISNELNLTLEHPNKLKYISVIYNTHVVLSNVRMWAAKIRRLHVARLLQNQLQQAGVDLSNITGDEPISQILGKVEDRVFNFASLVDGEGCEPQLLGDGLDEYLNHLEQNPVNIVGISSGYPYYDKSIGGGFRRRVVSLLSARIKMGKSIFSVNVALHISKILGIPVLYVDTEMESNDH